jgi:hypothetical protein
MELKLHQDANDEQNKSTGLKKKGKRYSSLAAQL